MKKNYTDIIIVLDRSGSMQSVRTDTIGGVNKFIEDQKKTPGEAKFTLCLFDHEYERTVNAIPIADVKPLTHETYAPRGNTCLYGAIGTSIREAGERFKAMPEDQRPEKVVVVIVTDGEENSSHKHEWSKLHTADSIKTAIELQSNTYKWEFVYIGANQDAIANAGRIGVDHTKAMNYTQNSTGTKELYGSLSANVSMLRCASKKDMSWETKDRMAQAAAAAD